VESLLDPLLPLFVSERAAGRAVALGVLVHTSGSTYRKAGALMLIAGDGQYAGLLSGGCLEGDLGQRAHEVIRTGVPRLVTYDTRGGDDLIWGLGLGCEGAMQILLLRVGPRESWQPLRQLAAAFAHYRRAAVGIVLSTAREDLPLGTLVLPGQQPQAPCGRALGAAATAALGAVAPTLALAQASARPALYFSGQMADPESESRARVGSGVLIDAALDSFSGERLSASQPGREAVADSAWIAAEGADWSLFALPLTLPPKILLLGAGPDAAPLADLAARLNWKVTLCDHRPAYAVATHFPGAERVVHSPVDEVFAALDPAPFAAAVVMSHHLGSDLGYLQALVATDIPYIGLLGPAARRERLLADLGPESSRLRERLHAPVGLALGGRAPEDVALAIVAEIQAFLHGPGGASRFGGT
jgi:xanthine dehydrogenase accessory factor